MRKLQSGFLALGVLAVIGLSLVACGGSGSDSGSASVVPASPTPELTGKGVLELAAEATGNLDSFHFVLSHESGSTPLPLNLNLESAEGDVVVPGKLSAEVDAKAAGINVSVRIIGIDDQTWVTNPFTRQWQDLPGTDIRDFADPAALVAGVLPAIKVTDLSDGGTVDGAKSYLVRGTIDSGALSDALGLAEPGRAVEVEAWVGMEDFLPRRIRLAGALSDSDSSGVVRQVVLSRFDEAVEIMPPE